jgi:hypothetical protein
VRHLTRQLAQQTDLALARAGQTDVAGQSPPALPGYCRLAPAGAAIRSCSATPHGAGRQLLSASSRGRSRSPPCDGLDRARSLLGGMAYKVSAPVISPPAPAPPSAQVLRGNLVPQDFGSGAGLTTQWERSSTHSLSVEQPQVSTEPR